MPLATRLLPFCFIRLKRVRPNFAAEGGGGIRTTEPFCRLEAKPSGLGQAERHLIVDAKGTASRCGAQRSQRHGSRHLAAALDGAPGMRPRRRGRARSRLGREPITVGTVWSGRRWFSEWRIEDGAV
jgi:hypothetical protein